jgi:hypothetical protein
MENMTRSQVFFEIEEELENILFDLEKKKIK